MITIGLTGGIASGKSTVAQALAELGAVVLDADEYGHELLRPGTETWREVVAAFGQEFLLPDGRVDRRKLGDLVFHKPSARERLNRIMHPRIRASLEERVADLRRQGAEVVVVEAALLIEASWATMVDEVWVTQAPEEVVVRRLQERDGFSREQALARIRSQLSPEERSRHAQVVIHNDDDLEDTKRQVEEQWQRLKAGGFNSATHRLYNRSERLLKKRIRKNPVNEAEGP